MTDEDDTMDADDEPGASGTFGDFGDETRKLMSAVQDWVRRTFPEPPSGHGGPECQWCPLCQFASVVRGERPEVTEKLAEAGAALANAFKVFVDSAVAHAPGSAPGGTAPRGKPQPAPRVQHIKLDDPADSGDEI